MANIYFDRWGAEHTSNDNSAIRQRAGAFIILKTQNSILFNFADYAPDVPDLPGGGIDAGETPFQAAIRELYEESELIAPDNLKVERELSQFVRFYAEHDDEYWDYQQTFFLITQDIDSLYFQGVRDVVEGRCAWIRMNDIKDYTIHHMHGLVLQKLRFTT